MSKDTPETFSISTDKSLIGSNPEHKAHIMDTHLAGISDGSHPHQLPRGGIMQVERPGPESGSLGLAWLCPRWAVRPFPLWSLVSSFVKWSS